MLTQDAKSHLVEVAIPGSFSTVATAFLQDSIVHMIPWLMVTCAVIMCDLICGIRCSMLLGDDIRFSSAVRRTMGKMVTYFAFCVMVCMISVATGGANKIDIYACLMVCFVEFCSILNNLLKPKGYNLDLQQALMLIGSRLLKTGKEDLKDVVHKTDDKEESK